MSQRPLISEHRLATLSASEVLGKLSSAPPEPILTGLPTIDVLVGAHGGFPGDSRGLGGIPRGEITEVCGPPGVGTSGLVLQIAANVLRAGKSVVWVDTSSTLCQTRLNDMLQRPSGDEVPREGDADKGQDVAGTRLRFHHLVTPTLPHLLALLTCVGLNFPPTDAGLMIIDCFSSLIGQAFPKSAETRHPGSTTRPVGDAIRWASSRRWPVINEILARLIRTATTTNISVILVNQMTTRVRPDTGALLYPAISGSGWENGTSNRITIFRDWPNQPEDDAGGSDTPTEWHFAAVSKSKGVARNDPDAVVAFTIGKYGLTEHKIIAADTVHPIQSLNADIPHKRKFDEVADSESELSDIDLLETFDWPHEERLIVAAELSS